MSSLLVICNMAPHYRAAIFKQMDQYLGCDFVFGNPIKDIRPIDYSTLSHQVTVVENCYISKFYYQKGVIRFIKEDYDTFLLTGDARCISTWLFLLLSQFFPKKRVYLWSHGWLNKKKGFSKLISLLFYHLATGAFIYNNRSRELMIAGGIPSAKLTTIYNSLDYNRQLELRTQLSKTTVYEHHFGNTHPTIIFIGRLNRIKRIDMLIKAVSLLQKRGELYNLVVVGDGEMSNELRGLSSTLRMGHSVWFYGESYDEETNAELLFGADLCVSPGNIGLTAIHSMMYGCPCLTHDLFDLQMPEFEAIKENETGAFFPFGDVGGLANSISWWFTRNSSKRLMIREKCFEEVDLFWNVNNQIRIFSDTLFNSN